MHKLGEYPIAVKFPVSTYVVSILFYGANKRGKVVIDLFRIDGTVISSVTIEKVTNGPYYFSTPIAEIAGFSIWNTDVGGLGIAKIGFNKENIIPGTFVAVSNSGTGDRVMTSPDGIDWTSQTTVDNAWTDVAWNGSILTAVAASGTNRCMTSTDGVAWTTHSCPSRIWVSVAWSEDLNLFAAVSFDGYVMTSSNGSSWTEYTPSTTGRNWSDICAGPGKFVAVASGPNANTDYYRHMTSTNGTTWTVGLDFNPTTVGGYSIMPGPWREVERVANQYVAIAQGTFTGSPDRSGQIMVSSDGDTWAPVLSPSDVWNMQHTGLTWDNTSTLVTVSVNMGTPSDNNWVMKSTDDGNTWTANSPSGINPHWRSVAWGVNTFVAVADTTNVNNTTDLVMTSSDGVNWTAQTPAAYNNWQNVKFCPGLIM